MTTAKSPSKPKPKSKGPPKPKAPATHPNDDPSYPYYFFYGHAPTNPLGPLSQWHATSFSESGTTFATAEHYMMYHKAQLFDPAAGQAILDAPGPREAKALGRGVRNFDPDVSPGLDRRLRKDERG
jgi:hypothetical protein